MNIEHFALNVADPVAWADWYVRHLDMRVVRSLSEAPHTRFLADTSGRTVIEVYNNTKAPIPDYAALDPMSLHVAFVAPDIPGTRDRLLAAGATSAIDITRSPNGDEMAFLRDPWGVTIQLVKRAQPLMEAETK